jgi:hypothetical protein
MLRWRLFIHGENCAARCVIICLLLRLRHVQRVGMSLRAARRTTKRRTVIALLGVAYASGPTAARCSDGT